MISSISSVFTTVSASPSRISPRGSVRHGENGQEIETIAKTKETHPLPSAKPIQNQETESEEVRSIASDPRFPESIISSNEQETTSKQTKTDEQTKTEKEEHAKSEAQKTITKREATKELATLYGEKNALNREQSEEKNRGSGETTAIIAKLAARDGEVRAHEAAHVAAGGAYVTGGASFSYQNGPDGKRYAVGGEVGIDSAPVSGNPEATVVKMRVVRAAALAPAEPSGADLSVAGAASQAETQARMDIAANQREELRKVFEKSAPEKNSARLEVFA